MRISFVIDNFSIGGKERQLFYLIKHLYKKETIQLIVFSKDIFFSEIFDFSIEIILFNKEDKYSLKTINKLYKKSTAFKPEIIHVWENLSIIALLPYILTHKVKLISSIRYAGKLKKNLKGAILKKIAHTRSSAVVSNSKKGLVVENLVNNPKGKVIYNGIDEKRFDKESFQLNSGLPFDEFSHVVVMVANFTPAKDYLTFIKTARMISENNRCVCFLCVGEGEKRVKAEKASGNYLNKTIFFLGSRDDIPAILKKSTIGVLLNNTNGHAEGISNAIMEYMAAGLPVIATNAGGTPALVQDGISGFLVPAFNENIVAEKISYLINNLDKARKMGKKGREIIINEFSIVKMSSAYLELYKKLIHE